MKKTHGFTLIELMIVIAILGILLALIIPACSSEESAYRFKCVDQEGNVIKSATLRHMPRTDEGSWWLGAEQYTPLPGSTCSSETFLRKKGER